MTAIILSIERHANTSIPSTAIANPSSLVDGSEVAIGLVDLVFGEDSEAPVVQTLGSDAHALHGATVESPGPSESQRSQMSDSTETFGVLNRIGRPLRHPLTRILCMPTPPGCGTDAGTQHQPRTDAHE